MEYSLLHQSAQKLGGEEGVALGVPLEIVRQASFVDRIEAPSRAHERTQILRFEPAQVESQSLRLSDQRREMLIERVATAQLVGPIGHDQ